VKSRGDGRWWRDIDAGCDKDDEGTYYDLVLPSCSDLRHGGVSYDGEERKQVRCWNLSARDGVVLGHRSEDHFSRSGKKCATCRVSIIIGNLSRTYQHWKAHGRLSWNKQEQCKRRWVTPDESGSVDVR